MNKYNLTQTRPDKKRKQELWFISIFYLWNIQTGSGTPAQTRHSRLTSLTSGTQRHYKNRINVTTCKCLKQFHVRSLQIQCQQVMSKVTNVHFVSCQTKSYKGPDPPENCHLNVKKLPKSLKFFQKNCQNFSFFSKKCH